MSTDDFTTAARVRANGQWPMQEERHAFVTGAVWARDHLAAQEPTDREVQEAATALLAFIHNEPVERIREVYGVLDRDGHWSTQARAALSASRAARLDEEKR